MVKVWILESMGRFGPIMIESVFRDEDKAWERKRKMEELDKELEIIVHGPFHVE